MMTDQDGLTYNVLLIGDRFNERFPNGMPGNEVLISPAGIFNSELLTTVYEQ